MDWESELNILLEERNITWLVSYLLNNRGEMPQIIDLINSGNEKIAWRAAWVLDHITMENPEISTPFFPEILQTLKQTPFNGVRRSLLRIMVTTPTELNEDGELLDLCFKWINSPAFPIAVRAHSMQFVFDLLPKYPELKNEFSHSLEFALDDESKGVRSKARKLLAGIGDRVGC
jgi:hypothetical protein